ncbi:MAG: VOC family protein [SAR324 cluster bacterium]|nr:VOC family protein [SAR324 cluster bacterium]MCH8885394.1 VOC family protein [SAR324 cluster bacterium]
MTEPPQLDHTVINARFDMDRAEAVYRDFGFCLTGRGFHSLGSINHLMMFGDNYLELIGLPPGADAQRPHIAEAPFGINGLVFKTSDVDSVYAHLRALGMDGDPPNSFSRPVKLPAGEFSARFRTVTVRPDIFPGGRVYFCEHGTPQLVWRPEWQNHANGTTAIHEVVVVSERPRDEAENFAKLLHSEVEGESGTLGVPLSGSRIALLSPASYQERYGALASPMAGRPSIFGAVVFQTGGLDAVRKVLGQANSPFTMAGGPNRVVIHDSTFDSVLEFIRES